MRYTSQWPLAWILFAASLLTASCSDESTSPNNEAPEPSALTHLWSLRAGDAQTQIARAVSVDGLGNVYVVGFFQGAMNFGGVQLTSAGSDDVFVASFDPAGAHRWSKRFGDSEGQGATGVIVDLSGNIVVVGGFVGTVNFGGEDLTGPDDLFLASFDPTGAHRWSRSVGDAGAMDLAVDGSGNLTVVGIKSYDIALASFDPSGNPRWSKTFGDAEAQYGTSVAVDNAGDATIIGSFDGTVNFGGDDLTAVGPQEIFVASFDPTGSHRWSGRFGSSGTEFGWPTVAVDAAGNPIVTGYFNGTLNFGGDDLTSADGEDDIFIAYLDVSGNHVWSKHVGSPGYQRATNVAVAPSGDVILTGWFDASVNFGGRTLTAQGASDLFVVSFDSEGQHRWSERYGANNAQHPHDVAVDGSGNVIVTGWFGGSVNFGGNNLVSAGDADVFLVSLEQ